MLNCFKQGGNYTEVNYGEYVLIDTVLNEGKNSDPENGLLFRRGFNYTEEKNPKRVKPIRSDFKQNDIIDEEAWQVAWSDYVLNLDYGAIYVGQIVGPEGSIPEIKVVKWQDLINKPAISGQSTVNLFSTRPSWNGVIGSTIDNSIKAAWLNSRDSNEQITGCEISFDFPKTVMKANLVSSDPYLLPSEIGVKENSATTSSGFAYQWDFKIPGGKPGTSVESIQINRDETSTGEKIANFQLILKDYSNSATGTETSKNIGKYNIIEDIDINYLDSTITEILGSGSPITSLNKGDYCSFRIDNETIYGICIQSGAAFNDNWKDAQTLNDLNEVGSFKKDLEIYSNMDSYSPAFIHIIDNPLTSKKPISLELELSNSEDNKIIQLNNLIDKIFVDSDNHLQLKYTNENDFQDLGDISPKNEIEDLKLYNNKLIAFYSSLAFRNKIKENGREGINWIKYPSSSQDIWQIVGIVSSQFIINETIEAGNDFPSNTEDFINKYLAVKDGDSYTYYLYNNKERSWYSVNQSISTAIDPRKIMCVEKEKDNKPDTDIELNENGYWFVITED